MSDGSMVLAEHCRQVAESATSAIQWLSGLRFRAPEQRQLLEQELRHVAWRAEVLRRNVARPANVALFGPNQSGKSFLAASLARRGTPAPRILLGTEKLDYLATTNASSPARSSACVTRFSLRRPEGVPAGLGEGLVVPVRLLSQADVIRIVANAYLEDIDPSAVETTPVAELASLFQSLTAQAGPRAVPGLSAQDVRDIRHYFDHYYAEHPVMRTIGDDFWAQAAALAPRLDGARRAMLFAPFWGGIPQLGSLSARLLAALDALGNAGMAFAEKAALTAGSASIGEVETMMQGLEDDNAPRLRIGTVAGHVGDIARPVLAALTAELHLTLEQAPHGFFQEADLLDFPGALPRNRFTDPESLLADPTNRAWLFRRGKAAYLFQRYASEQELDALVLSLEDGPQTARTLPGLVKEWIDVSHGGSPEERAKLPCGLFVALTKFDLELKDQLAQKEDDPEHWSQRLQGVFGNFLSREHRWAENWTPGRAFSNTFWVRQTAFVDQDLLQYDASGRETGVADRARMTKLRARYLQSAAATRHFGDASRAWDEAMRLNDGGVGYLATQLRAVCEPDTRRRQVAEALAGLARDLQQILEPFHSASHPARQPAEVSAAPVEEMAVAEEAVAEAVAEVEEAAAEVVTLTTEAAPVMDGVLLLDASGVGGGQDGWVGRAEALGAASGDGGGGAGTGGGGRDLPQSEGMAPAPMPDMADPAPREELRQSVPVGAGVTPGVRVLEEQGASHGSSDQGSSGQGSSGQGSSGKMIAIGGVLAVAVVGVVAAWLMSGSPGPAAPGQAGAPAGVPMASAPADTTANTAPEEKPAVVAAPAEPAAPAAPPLMRCGPVQGPERLSVLPAGVTLTPSDLVCVARRWAEVGRPGDAVMLLTRALQESPNRVFGPASLELARIYDPSRETPGWPTNAAFAEEKYRDAANDAANPETQEQARSDLEKLLQAK